MSPPPEHLGSLCQAIAIVIASRSGQLIPLRSDLVATISRVGQRAGFEVIRIMDETTRERASGEADVRTTPAPDVSRLLLYFAGHGIAGVWCGYCCVRAQRRGRGGQSRYSCASRDSRHPARRGVRRLLRPPRESLARILEHDLSARHDRAHRACRSSPRSRAICASAFDATRCRSPSRLHRVLMARCADNHEKPPSCRVQRRPRLASREVVTGPSARLADRCCIPLGQSVPTRIPARFRPHPLAHSDAVTKKTLTVEFRWRSGQHKPSDKVLGFAPGLTPSS